MSIAKDFNGFVKTLTEALKEKLNAPEGQEITKQLLEMKLEQNPGLTTEEWQQTKNEFLTFLFLQAVKSKPELAEEMSHHVWNELH